MAKGALLKASFTAGELSPRLAGRVDIAKYAGGAKQLRNALPRVQGGARKRGGFRLYDTNGGFMTASMGAARVLPFVSYSASSSVPLAYAIVLNNTKALSCYMNSPNAGAAATIPWTGTFGNYERLRYAQSGNTMFVTAPGYAPRRVVRYDTAAFFAEAVTWDPAPASDVGERQNTTCTASATTGSITLTAGANAFRATDVGRFYEDGTGRAKITAFTSATVVSATVEVALNSGARPANTWKLIGPPITTVTPSATGPIGQSITLTAGANTWKDGTFATSHVGAFVEINGGLVEITAVSSATAATGEVRQPLSSTIAAPARSWRLLFSPWNAQDGYPAAVALHQQRLYMAATTAQPTTMWATNLGEYYNFAAGTAEDAGFSFEIASDSYDPIRHLTSAGELLIFTGGSEFVARGGVETPISPTTIQIKPQSAHGSDEARPARIGREVVFLERHGRRARALTYDAATDQFVAPDISVLAEHLLRESAVKAWAFTQSPEPILWMLRNDGKLISLSYDRDQDVFAYALQELPGATIVDCCALPIEGQDRLVLYLTRGGRYMLEFYDTDAAMDHQQDMVPNPRVGTVSWSSGTATVTEAGHPLTTGDKVWISNGDPAAAEVTATVIDPNTWTYPWPVTMSVVSYYRRRTTWLVGADPDTSGNDSRSLTGVFFYKTAMAGTAGADSPWIYGGAISSNSSGQITTPTAVYAVRFGIPYTTTIQTLPPEIAGPEGTAQGQAVSVSEVVVRLLDSCGGTVKGAGNAQPLPNPLAADAVAAPWTGDYPLSTMGWGKNVRGGGWDGTITLEHSDPAPFEVLAIIQKLTVNAG